MIIRVVLIMTMTIILIIISENYNPKISVRRFHSSSCSCFYHLQIGERQRTFVRPSKISDSAATSSPKLCCPPCFVQAEICTCYTNPQGTALAASGKSYHFLKFCCQFRSLNNLGPAYINSLLKNYKPSRNLRSVDQGLLTVPRSNQRIYGDRAFSVPAPKLWNALIAP